MKKLTGSLAVIAFLAIPASSAWGGSPKLDPTFGDSGIAFVQGSPSKQIGPARKVALDSKGRLVALGNSPDGDLDEMVLGRFRSVGDLDNHFGTDGLIYTADFKRDQPIGYGMDLTFTSGGKIATTGPMAPAGSFPPDNDMCFFASRQFSNGALDRRFAYNGRNKVCIHREPPKRSIGLDSRAITSSAAGKIVVAGVSHHSSVRKGAFVARLNGEVKTLDRTFKGTRRTRLGRAGMVEIALREGQVSFEDVKALNGGKILAAGTIQGRFMAARFLRDGRRDPSFGKNGVSSFDLDGQPGCECSIAVAMTRDRHGRILLAGYTMKYELGEADRQPTVIRLKRNGRLDRSFGESGVARPQLSEYIELPDGTPVRHYLTTGMTIQKDGRIVISGQYNFRYSLLRLKPNGKLDPTFFDAGLYVDWVRGRYGAAWDVITDRKGRIVSSGGTNEGGFVLMRMLPG